MPREIKDEERRIIAFDVDNDILYLDASTADRYKAAIRWLFNEYVKLNWYSIKEFDEEIKEVQERLISDSAILELKNKLTEEDFELLTKDSHKTVDNASVQKLKDELANAIYEKEVFIKAIEEDDFDSILYFVEKDQGWSAYEWRITYLIDPLEKENA